MKAKSKKIPSSGLRFAGLVLLALALAFAIVLIWNLPPSYSSASDAQRKILDYASANGLSYNDYPKSLIELLERNPETEKFVLEYPTASKQVFSIDLSGDAHSETVPLFLQWDQRWGYMQYGSDVAGLTACGPLCLAMAGFYLTGDNAFSPDNMIRFAIEEGYCVKGNGTAWSLFSEGAEKLGLKSRELPLDGSVIQNALEQGDPVVCIMGPGDFTTTGHFILLWKWEDGMLRINDPNSRINSEKAWSFAQIQDQIRNIWVISK